MRRLVSGLSAALLLLGLFPGAAAADHDAPSLTGAAPGLGGAFQSGGEEAEWELLNTFPTGNPHTDLDFFRQDGALYVSVGTLATSVNGGGQQIFQLLDDQGEYSPEFVSNHPSAACPSLATGVTGLQHDVEATPKGDVIFNTDWGDLADTRDAQLIIDTSDAPGRCHDNGALSLNAPPGGLELVDITDIAEPVEIALTSHIGEAHTVNVDPKRPHIVYAVPSDQTSIEDGERTNETEGNALDGFEVLDISSCMDFAEDATVEQKRGVDADTGEFLEGEGCRPEVFRFRFPLGWTRGTLNADTQATCHELEVYPDDTLACAGLESMVLMDISGIFDDQGSPDDFTDDTLRGDPLPCSVRASTSSATPTAAPVIDCVTGEDDADLTVSGWLEAGAPALDGWELIGFVNHAGRDGEANTATHSPTEDIAVDHEAELTHSGKFVLATDERGGAIVPPDAACPVPTQQPAAGNGGIHAFDVDELFTEYPGDPETEDLETIAERARTAYAETPEGDKPIYRAEIRVPAETLCTAHVFHQIPGQNRIFMGWYTQGTQVVDYIEHLDGTFEWREAGWFIPENANTWTSAVFDFEENDDGTFTYRGATGDFILSEHGRNAVDVYEATLPPPAEPVTRLAGPTRIQTAVDVSQASHPEPDSAGAVVLARADDFADAMAGTPFARDMDAPLLLSPPEQLHPDTRAEIERVLAAGGTVHLLGGTDALSAGIEQELADAGFDTDRIGGPTRFETATLIADRLGDPGTIFVTRGDVFVDAITAASAAVRVGATVVLSAGDDAHPTTDAYLAEHPDAEVFAIGGPAAAAYPDPTPIVGEEREDTAVAVAERFFPDVSAVGIARRDKFPDSLTGGVHIGTLDGPMLVTPSDTLDPVVERYLCDNAGIVGAAAVYGGTEAIADSVRTAIEDRMRGLGC